MPSIHPSSIKPACIPPAIIARVARRQSVSCLWRVDATSCSAFRPVYRRTRPPRHGNTHLHPMRRYTLLSLRPPVPSSLASCGLHSAPQKVEPSHIWPSIAANVTSMAGKPPPVDAGARSLETTLPHIVHANADDATERVASSVRNPRCSRRRACSHVCRFGTVPIRVAIK